MFLREYCFELSNVALYSCIDNLPPYSFKHCIGGAGLIV